MHAITKNIPENQPEMIVKRVSVPVGLEELMEGLTKEVLLKKPKDLYVFASEYFSRLVNLRERSSTRKTYPIRTVQSVTHLKTPNIINERKVAPPRTTRHFSRQIRGKSPMIIKSHSNQQEPEKNLREKGKDIRKPVIDKKEDLKALTRSTNKKEATPRSTSSVQSTPRDRSQRSTSRPSKDLSSESAKTTESLKAERRVKVVKKDAEITSEKDAKVPNKHDPNKSKIEKSDRDKVLDSDIWAATTNIEKVSELIVKSNEKGFDEKPIEVVEELILKGVPRSTDSVGEESRETDVNLKSDRNGNHVELVGRTQNIASVGPELEESNANLNPKVDEEVSFSIENINRAEKSIDTVLNEDSMKIEKVLTETIQNLDEVKNLADVVEENVEIKPTINGNKDTTESIPKHTIRTEAQHNISDGNKTTDKDATIDEPKPTENNAEIQQTESAHDNSANDRDSQKEASSYSLSKKEFAVPVNADNNQNKKENIVNIKMEQMGGSDDVLIVSISEASGSPESKDKKPDQVKSVVGDGNLVKVVESTTSGDVEKHRFFRKNKELGSKEDHQVSALEKSPPTSHRREEYTILPSSIDKIGELKDTQSEDITQKMIRDAGLIDAPVREFLTTFIQSEQQNIFKLNKEDELKDDGAFSKSNIVSTLNSMPGYEYNKDLVSDGKNEASSPPEEVKDNVDLKSLMNQDVDLNKISDDSRNISVETKSLVEDLKDKSTGFLERAFNSVKDLLDFDSAKTMMETKSSEPITTEQENSGDSSGDTNGLKLIIVKNNSNEGSPNEDSNHGALRTRRNVTVDEVEDISLSVPEIGKKKEGRKDNKSLGSLKIESSENSDSKVIHHVNEESVPSVDSNEHITTGAIDNPDEEEKPVSLVLKVHTKVANGTVSNVEDKENKAEQGDTSEKCEITDKEKSSDMLSLESLDGLRISKANTFVRKDNKDRRSEKRRPKIGDIEQVATVIEVVKSIFNAQQSTDLSRLNEVHQCVNNFLQNEKEDVFKCNTETKKQKSKLVMLGDKRGRTKSHANILSGSKIALPNTKEGKVRRARSVGVIKTKEPETKSKIPTPARRSAGRRPLVRQLEADSKELEEKLNFKRSTSKGSRDEKMKIGSGSDTSIQDDIGSKSLKEGRSNEATDEDRLIASTILKGLETTSERVSQDKVITLTEPDEIRKGTENMEVSGCTIDEGKSEEVKDEVKSRIEEVRDRGNTDVKDEEQQQKDIGNKTVKEDKGDIANGKSESHKIKEDEAKSKIEEVRDRGNADVQNKEEQQKEIGNKDVKVSIGDSTIEMSGSEDVKEEEAKRRIEEETDQANTNEQDKEKQQKDIEDMEVKGNKGESMIENGGSEEVEEEEAKSRIEKVRDRANTDVQNKGEQQNYMENMEVNEHKGDNTIEKGGSEEVKDEERKTRIEEVRYRANTDVQNTEEQHNYIQNMEVRGYKGDNTIDKDGSQEIKEDEAKTIHVQDKEEEQTYIENMEVKGQEEGNTIDKGGSEDVKEDEEKSRTEVVKDVRAKSEGEAAAAIKLQSAWKGFMVRKQMKSSNVSKNSAIGRRDEAIIKIQSFVRGFLQRLRYNELKSKRLKGNKETVDQKASKESTKLDGGNRESMDETVQKPIISTTNKSTEYNKGSSKVQKEPGNQSKDDADHHKSRALGEVAESSRSNNEELTKSGKSSFDEHQHVNMEGDNRFTKETNRQEFQSNKEGESANNSNTEECEETAIETEQNDNTDIKKDETIIVANKIGITTTNSKEQKENFYERQEEPEYPDKNSLIDDNKPKETLERKNVEEHFHKSTEHKSEGNNVEKLQEYGKLDDDVKNDLTAGTKDQLSSIHKPKEEHEEQERDSSVKDKKSLESNETITNSESQHKHESERKEKQEVTLIEDSNQSDQTPLNNKTQDEEQDKMVTENMNDEQTKPITSIDDKQRHESEQKDKVGGLKPNENAKNLQVPLHEKKEVEGEGKMMSEKQTISDITRTDKYEASINEKNENQTLKQDSTKNDGKTEHSEILWKAKSISDTEKKRAMINDKKRDKRNTLEESTDRSSKSVRDKHETLDKSKKLDTNDQESLASNISKNHAINKRDIADDTQTINDTEEVQTKVLQNVPGIDNPKILENSKLNNIDNMPAPTSELNKIESSDLGLKRGNQKEEVNEVKEEDSKASNQVTEANSKPDFHRSDTVVEPEVMKKHIPHLGYDADEQPKDDNNNYSKNETNLEKDVRSTVEKIMSSGSKDGHILTPLEAEVHQALKDIMGSKSEDDIKDKKSQFNRILSIDTALNLLPEAPTHDIVKGPAKTLEENNEHLEGSNARRQMNESYDDSTIIEGKNVFKVHKNDFETDENSASLEVPTDNISSVSSADSVVTVILKPKQESKPKSNTKEDSKEIKTDVISSKKILHNKALSTSALDDHVNLLDKVQNSLLDQLSGKPGNTSKKFDIDELRKELHEAATVYKRDEHGGVADYDPEIMEYLYDFEPEDEDDYESRVVRTPLRELADIAEETEIKEEEIETQRHTQSQVSEKDFCESPPEVTGQSQGSEKVADMVKQNFCGTPVGRVQKVVDGKPLDEHVEIINTKINKEGTEQSQEYEKEADQAKQILSETPVGRGQKLVNGKPLNEYVEKLSADNNTEATDQGQGSEKEADMVKQDFRGSPVDRVQKAVDGKPLEDHVKKIRTNINKEGTEQSQASEKGADKTKQNICETPVDQVQKLVNGKLLDDDVEKIRTETNREVTEHWSEKEADKIKQNFGGSPVDRVQKLVDGKPLEDHVEIITTKTNEEGTEQGQASEKGADKAKQNICETTVDRVQKLVNGEPLNDHVEKLSADINTEATGQRQGSEKEADIVKQDFGGSPVDRVQKVVDGKPLDDHVEIITTKTNEEGTEQSQASEKDADKAKQNICETPVDRVQKLVNEKSWNDHVEKLSVDINIEATGQRQESEKEADIVKQDFGGSPVDSVQKVVDGNHLEEHVEIISTKINKQGTEQSQESKKVGSVQKLLGGIPLEGHVKNMSTEGNTEVSRQSQESEKSNREVRETPVGSIQKLLVGKPLAEHTEKITTEGNTETQGSEEVCGTPVDSIQNLDGKPLEEHVGKLSTEDNIESSRLCQGSETAAEEGKKNFCETPVGSVQKVDEKSLGDHVENISTEVDTANTGPSHQRSGKVAEKSYKVVFETPVGNIQKLLDGKPFEDYMEKISTEGSIEASRQTQASNQKVCETSVGSTQKLVDGKSLEEDVGKINTEGNIGDTTQCIESEKAAEDGQQIFSGTLMPSTLKVVDVSPKKMDGRPKEIIINDDNIKINTETQRENQESVVIPAGPKVDVDNDGEKSMDSGPSSIQQVVVPLAIGSDVKIRNESRLNPDEPSQERNTMDSGNQTSTQQSAAGVEAVTSPRRDSRESSGVADVAQASLKDTSSAKPRSGRSFTDQSLPPRSKQAMESESNNNNNNKKNNAISSNLPSGEKNMEAQAATKIQAGFRGYQVRKQLKTKNTATDQKRQLRKRSSRENVKSSDLEEKSAVKIQAGVRGFLVRRRQKKQINSSASA